MRFERVTRDPRVRRYAGVAAIAAVVAGIAIGQWIAGHRAFPDAVCAPGRAAAVAMSAPQTAPADTGSDVPVTVLSCDDLGVADLSLVVSSPPREATVPAQAGGVDLMSASDCHRDSGGNGAVLLLCGPLAPRDTRHLTLTVVPHGVGAQDPQLVVTATDVGRRGPDHPVILDAAGATLRTPVSSGGLTWWSEWIAVAVALLIGVDMARRSRSGLRWTIGMLVFPVLGWFVWLRDRKRWAVVPAGVAAVALPDKPWIHRYSFAIGVAVPALIVAFVIAGVVSATIGHQSAGPFAVATPPPSPTNGTTAAAPTPCAGGSLPAAMANATQVVSLCNALQPAPIHLHVGDTLALVLPPGAQGAGSNVEVLNQQGAPPVLLDTGLGTPAAALLLAHAQGTVTVQVVSICSGFCAEAPSSITFTVTTDA